VYVAYNEKGMNLYTILSTFFHGKGPPTQKKKTFFLLLVDIEKSK